MVMNLKDLVNAIESILFVSGDVVSIKDLCKVFDVDETQLKKVMDYMIRIFNEDNRGLSITKIKNGYQMCTKPKYSKYIEAFCNNTQKQVLSQAALETLAIICYKQPITKADIEMIRGVKSDSAIATLLNKGLIKETGRLDTQGRPILYGTTDELLRYLGLESLEKLPSPDDI
ncbi:MAG TPA: SMC-Scp complex subunit ScpB [Clostridiales bacterium]|nr:SMC-Scp complex subunit ScpB [Clostridiales bacterium]